MISFEKIVVILLFRDDKLFIVVIIEALPKFIVPIELFVPILIVGALSCTIVPDDIFTALVLLNVKLSTLVLIEELLKLYN